jgi:hypothetical protein
MKRILVPITATLALLGMAVAGRHLTSAQHYNAGFVEHALTTRLHVALGALYLGLALLQFSGPARARWPRLHRVSGRIAVAAGLVAGFTALIIAVWFPFSGPAEMVVVWPFAGLFLFSLGRGVWLARLRRFAEHREWMIRAMAVGTSIVTMRLIFVPSLMILGESDELARWLSLTSFAAAFVIHSSVAEAWIRATRAASAEAVAGRGVAAAALSPRPGRGTVGASEG